MASVTMIAKNAEQPRGGFISPKRMKKEHYSDGVVLKEENISPNTVGMAVDYLARVAMGTEPEKAFAISLRGADLSGHGAEAKDLVDGIKGLDDESIRNACRLVGFDQVVRAGIMDPGMYGFSVPDDATCQNIRTMVERTVKFFEIHGPVLIDGVTFIGGYTDTVTSGDGDYVTDDTIWDLKVSKSEPTSKYTLQLAMYFLMGKRSVWPELQEVKKIGIFNPRLNASYSFDMGTLETSTVSQIEKIIGY